MRASGMCSCLYLPMPARLDDCYASEDPISARLMLVPNMLDIANFARVIFIESLHKI